MSKTRKTIVIEGELEIDKARGVIYFHAKMTGTTVLRICQLKIPSEFDRPLDGIDITTTEETVVMYSIT